MRTNTRKLLREKNAELYADTEPTAQKAEWSGGNGRERRGKTRIRSCEADHQRCAKTPDFCLEHESTKEKKEEREERGRGTTTP